VPGAPPAPLAGGAEEEAPGKPPCTFEYGAGASVGEACVNHCIRTEPTPIAPVRPRHGGILPGSAVHDRAHAAALAFVPQASAAKQETVRTRYEPWRANDPT
jgi:hypothetical protein